MYDNIFIKCLKLEIKACYVALKIIGKFDKIKPEGRLRVSFCRDKVSYYLCTNDHKGKYIKAKDRDIAIKIAIRECCDKVKKRIQVFLDLYLKILDEWEKGYWRDFKRYIHPEKLKLAEFPLADDIYVEKWLKEDYIKPNQADHYFETKKGDFVRSKSEAFLADKLYDEGIPYRYEQYLYLDEQNYLVPDFTILDVFTHQEIYVEHLGMLDDEDYAQHNVEKLREYAKHGIYMGCNLFCTYETKDFHYPFELLKPILNERFGAYKYDYKKHEEKQKKAG